MSFGFVEVDYKIAVRETDGSTSWRDVSGVQIGRFAVRQAAPGTIDAGNLPPVEDAPWRVDHVPSGLCVFAFADFEEAYAAADDLSRFSSRDMSAKDRLKVREQSGSLIVEWVLMINEPHYDRDGRRKMPKYIPFRDWLAEQGKTLRRRRMKKINLFGRN